MKGRSIILFVLIAPCQNAYALRPPDSAVLKTLNEEIAHVQTLQGNDEGDDPKKWSGILGLSKQLEQEISSISPDRAKIEDLKRRIADLKSEQAPLCQTLIDDTRKAYDIKPHHWSGPIVLNGDFNATPANWQPKFGEMDHARTKTNANGEQITMIKPTTYAAITWENGDIVVTIKSFLYSPGYLASILQHETIHFDQITTLGRGDQLTPGEREWQAYQAMRGRNSEIIFQLTSEEKRIIEDAFKKSMAEANSSPNSTMKGASEYATIAPEQDRADGDDAFLSGIAQIKPISQQARNTAAARLAADPEYLDYLANHERIIHEYEASRSQAADEYATEATRWAEESRTNHEKFEEMERSWDYLQAMTGLACSNPDALDQLGREGKAPGVGVSDIDWDWHMTRREGSGKNEHLVINECQMYILNAIRRANGMTSGHELTELARQYRGEHPTLIERFTTSIGEFFSSREATRRPSSEESARERNVNNYSRPSSASGNDGAQDAFRESMKKQNQELSKYDTIVHGVYAGTGGKSWDGNPGSRVTP
jgi:hypothetical protein